MKSEIVQTIEEALILGDFFKKQFKRSERWSSFDELPHVLTTNKVNAFGIVTWKRDEIIGGSFSKQISPELWYLSIIAAAKGYLVGGRVLKATLEEMKARGGQTIMTDTNDVSVNPEHGGAPAFLEKSLVAWCSNFQKLSRPGYYGGNPNQVGIIYLADLK